MESNKTKSLNTRLIKLYVFLAALAVNLFLGFNLVINRLSIQYFLYTTPMIIRLNLFSPFDNTLLWIGSLCLIYITKEVVKESPGSRLAYKFLNLALIGSCLILLSLIAAKTKYLAESTIISESFLSQFGFLTELIGIILLFVGSCTVLFALTFRDRKMLTLFLIYLFSLLIPLEIWALIHWVAYPIDPMSYSGFGWQGAFIELQLFYAGYPLIFWLFIAFLFSWVWVPVAKYAKAKIGLFRNVRWAAFLFKPHDNRSLLNDSTRRKSSLAKENVNRQASTSRFIPTAVLIACLLLGVFVAYYPYITPRFGFVGWDTLGYYEMLNTMVLEGPSRSLELAVATDRPLYFLLLYFLRVSTSLSSYVVIQLMPIVTILTNALAAFWFVKVGENRMLVAYLSAVFTIFSFNTTIGMHAGVLANWLAIGLAFVLFGLVLKLHEKRTLKHFFAAALVSAAILLVHYWTWMFFSLVLVCYGLLTWFERKEYNLKAKVAVFLLASLTLTSVFLSAPSLYFFSSYGSAPNLSPMDIAVLLWTRLPQFIHYWFFGALANPVMMALAAIGIVSCFSQRTSFRRLLISWTVVGSLISIAASPIGKNMNQWIMWRALYMIPFQIPAALGFYFLLSWLGLEVRAIKNVRFDRAVSYIGSLRSSINENYAVVFYLLVNYALSALLLNFDFPMLVVLILLNCFVVTLILHFKVRKNDSSILILIFALVVTLSLLNYTLRSLAPLTLNRMQP